MCTMIKLTGSDGKEFYLNAETITTMEEFKNPRGEVPSKPMTVIGMQYGTKVVKNTPEEVAQIIYDAVRDLIH